MWWRTDQELIDGLQRSPAQWTDDPDTWLINGKMVRNSSVDDAHPGDNQQLDVIHVEPDKTYRFRFVAATAGSLGIFAFENHTRLDMVQADGDYTKPHAVDVLQMGAGQRYDALLGTKTCEELKQLGKMDFYMQIESREQRGVVTEYAIVRYEDSCGFGDVKRLSTGAVPAAGGPLELPPTISGFLDYALEPLDSGGESFPSAAEVTRRVVYTMQQIEGRYTFWAINNGSWTEEADDPKPHTTPEEPYLVSLYRNRTAYLPDYVAAVAKGGRDPRTNTYPARVGEVIEVVLQQLGAFTPPGYEDDEALTGALRLHPWHAHGAKYWDAGGGEGAWDQETAEARLSGTLPVRRDTTLLYRYHLRTDPGAKGCWRVWRLRITQPGVWLVHCHTLAHMVQGMQTVWVHGEADDLLRVGRPDVEGYLKYGGDAYGNVSHAPRVLHFDELDP